MIKQIAIVCQVMLFFALPLGVCYADDKISELSTLTTPADADTYPLVDADAGTTKKITHANLKTAIQLPTASGAETVTGTEDSKAVTPLGLQSLLKDEDDMSSDSATHVPTQQSTKAYVDTQRQVIQTVSGTFTGVTTTTSQIPVDNSYPQLGTEGMEVIRVDITPTDASNKLHFWFTGFGGKNGSGFLSTALFQAATANAIKAKTEYVATANVTGDLTLHHVMDAGGTSEITFKIQVGPNSGTATINGYGGAEKFGGAAECVLVVEERKP